MRAQLRRWGWRVALSLGLLMLVGLVFAKEFRFFISPDPKVLLDVRDDIRTFEDLAQWPQAHGRLENHGFVPCTSGTWAEAGWCLPPGQRGILRYRLPKVPESRGLLVRLFYFRRDPAARNRLRVWREGESAPRLSFDNEYFADARLDLSSALSGSGEAVVLQFEGENPTATPDVILQYFEIRMVAEPLPDPPSVPAMVLAVSALGLCLLPLVSWRRLLPIGMILTLGFALRYYALREVFLLPLSWDAVGYHHLAQQMALFTNHGFYSARFGTREPLFLLLVKIVLWIFGDSETHVRFASLFASLVAIPLTYGVGARLFGRLLGLCGALVMAVSLPLVRESVNGMRLETELVLLLLFVRVAFLGSLKPLWRRAGLTGVMAGLLTLTRTTYVVTLLPMLVLAFLRERPVGRAGLATAVALVLMLGLHIPHRVSMYRLHGDAFFDEADWVRGFANYEFAGQPGYPSKRQVWHGSGRDGPKLTTMEYFFGLHTIPEFIAGTVRGLWKAVRHMEIIAFHRGVERLTGIHLAWVDSGFQLLGLLGLVLAIFDPVFQWIPVMFLALLLPITFFYDRGLIEPWRHTYQVFPWMLFGMLLVLWQVGQRGRGRLGGVRG